MTQEELKELTNLQQEIEDLEKHLNQLHKYKARRLRFDCDNTDILAMSSICNVEYLYNAYMHQVQAKLNTKKRMFEKWKLLK